MLINSQIVIPVAGVYRFLFSAQCDSDGSHYLEIWHVINRTSVPDSLTRISVPSSAESCLTVEYIGYCESSIRILYESR